MKIELDDFVEEIRDRVVVTIEHANKGLPEELI